MADSGKSDGEIAQMLKTGESTVHRTRQRFVTGNLGNALNEQPRSGRKRKLSGKQEALLVATACSQPPKGRRRWTMKLLAGRLVEIEEVGKIAAETIRLTLKKTNSSLGLKSNGVFRR
jgi:transposase